MAAVRARGGGAGGLLGYGERGVPPAIEPGETLVFVIDAVDRVRRP